ncbi:unnamed protein product, partial [Musa acuminata subsp. malaccensis]
SNFRFWFVLITEEIVNTTKYRRRASAIYQFNDMKKVFSLGLH